MRRTPVLPILLLVIVVGLVAVGFWRGWFVFSSSQDEATNKVDVNLSVDRDKMKSDTRHAAEVTKEKTREFSDKVKEEAHDVRDKVKSKTD